jgi:hypothetical protein
MKKINCPECGKELETFRPKKSLAVHIAHMHRKNNYKKKKEKITQDDVERAYHKGFYEGVALPKGEKEPCECICHQKIECQNWHTMAHSCEQCKPIEQTKVWVCKKVQNTNCCDLECKPTEPALLKACKFLMSKKGQKVVNKYIDEYFSKPQDKVWTGTPIDYGATSEDKPYSVVWKGELKRIEKPKCSYHKFQSVYGEGLNVGLCRCGKPKENDCHIDCQPEPIQDKPEVRECDCECHSGRWKCEHCNWGGLGKPVEDNPLQKEKLFKEAWIGGKHYKLNKKGVAIDLSKEPPEVLSAPQPKDTDWQPYFNEWVKQGGRNEDMRYGVRNFLTGQGMIWINNLLARERSNYKEEVIRKIKKFQGIAVPKADKFDKGYFTACEDILEVLEKTK